MRATARFNNTAQDRARNDLVMFQSNVIAQLKNGSEVRAIWDGCQFVDFEEGIPLDDVEDFWTDDRLAIGGFTPEVKAQMALRL